MWKRYRFKTKSVEDYRPLIFNPKYPWWCCGTNDEFATIIAYLPSNEILYDYWDDASDIEFDEREEITFTDRFDKPKWFVE